MALEPKLPPTKVEMTLTCDRGRPSWAATVSCVAFGPCVESQSVSRSPSQRAVVADVSIGLWWLAAHR
jgi:hypothetical protein